jgi:hypothetical protein
MLLGKEKQGWGSPNRHSCHRALYGKQLAEKMKASPDVRVEMMKRYAASIPHRERFSSSKLRIRHSFGYWLLYIVLPPLSHICPLSL